MIHPIFEYAYCINLKHRPDKKRQARKELERVDIPANFISAVDGSLVSFEDVLKFGDQCRDIFYKRTTRQVYGARGCIRSHTKLLELAKEQDFPWVVQLEDDVLFHKNFRELFPIYFKEVPDDWDMIFLGCVHKQQPIKVTEHVYKVLQPNTNHANIVRKSAYDKILKLYYEDSDNSDVLYHRLAKTLKMYSFRPQLAIQRIAESDIGHRHNFFKKDGRIKRKRYGILGNHYGPPKERQKIREYTKRNFKSNKPIPHRMGNFSRSTKS